MWVNELVTLCSEHQEFRVGVIVVGLRPWLDVPVVFIAVAAQDVVVAGIA